MQLIDWTFGSMAFRHMVFLEISSRMILVNIPLHRKLDMIPPVPLLFFVCVLRSVSSTIPSSFSIVVHAVCARARVSVRQREKHVITKASAS